MNELKQYKALLHDENAQKIEYSISANYVKNLDAVFGVKEFIANFYDVNKTDFTMTHQNNQLLIEDENTGIDIRYMIIGNSGSREFSDKIGEHGEGFKIGALTLVRLGHKVLIETVGYTIAFGIEQSTFLQSEVMFARYIPNDRKKGTKLFTECNAQTFSKAKAMFLHLSPFKQVTPHIIEMDSKRKNIYLNGLSHTTKKALFGYNIFEKNMVSNRDRNFISLPILKEQLTNIYSELDDKEAIHTVMHKMLEQPTSFHSLLEAKIFDELYLSEDQKSLYRNALNPAHYYYRKGTAVSDTNQQRQLVEVDEILYEFLAYIGAKVIENGKVIAKKEGVLCTYSLNKEQLPMESDVELSTAHIASDAIVVDGETVTIIPPKRSYVTNWFPSKEFFEPFATAFKVTTKLPQNPPYHDFKALWNHLILLACYDFDIAFFHHGYRYHFQKEGVQNDLSIEIHKQAVKDQHSKITMTKKCGFTNGVKEEHPQYIYAGCLKYDKINALYSYQLPSGTIESRYNVFGCMEKLIAKQVQTKTITFVKAYLERMNENLYEHDAFFDVREKEKPLFRKLFATVYPKHVISSTKVHDDIVKNQYGFHVLKLPTLVMKRLLMEIVGIPDATQMFMEKQKEDIHVIPNSPELEEAIALFRDMTQSDTPVYLTPILPNNTESLHRKGCIYISQEAPPIPVYLAGLMAYEDCQASEGFTKVTHNMQSHLTHYILG